MRTALLLAAATGCAGPSGAHPDAAPDAPLDAAIEPYERTVNAVLVAGEDVFWSHGRFACALEYPCPLEGASVTTWRRSSNRATVRYEGGIGARSIVGDATERFFVTGLDLESTYVVRDRGIPIGLSIPRPKTIGPALDATHVYWADRAIDQADYTLRRATRDGDGSDASVVAADVPMDGDSSDFVVASGHVWWLALGKLRRVPVTGGPVADVAPALAGPRVLAAAGDAVYVASRTQATGVEIGRVDADGAYTVLAQHVTPDAHVPRFLVATDDALYWSLRDGNIYRAPLAGGTVETIAAGDRLGHAFAVLPDQILVELTGDSFRAIPRP